MFLRYLLLLTLLLSALPGRAQPDVTLDYNQPAERQLYQQLPDSLAALQRYHRLGQPAAAERAADFLLTRFPGPVKLLNAPFRSTYAASDGYPQQVYQRRAELRRARHDWRGAEADLTAAIRYARLAEPNDPRLGSTYQHVLVAFLRETHYDRAQLRLDHLGNRPGGCADLATAYQYDTVRASSPRWRGCPMPRCKFPVGIAERQAYGRALLDSLSRAEQLLTAGQPAAARHLLTTMLNTGAAGGYAPDFRPRIGQPASIAVGNNWDLRAREIRSRASQALGEYARAVADLDTLIQYHGKGIPDYYCYRGVLRADYLHDQDGACRDLNQCYSRGRSVPGRRPTRGCDIAAQHLGARLGRSSVAHLFDGAQYPVWQGGFVRQGRLTGIQAGRLFANDDEIGNTEWIGGPAVGVELAGNATEFVMAPRLSYELVKVAVGLKLDATYYLNQDLRGDLRLTPQLGLCPLGALNIYYGYAIPVAGTRIEGLGSHRVSVYLNMLRLGKIGG